MVVVRLECPVCGTEVTGDFELCPACSLEGEHKRILEIFLESRGNMREVQRRLKVSYPTARQRVEEMFWALRRHPPGPDAKVVLERVESGEIDVDTAVRLLSEGQ